MTTFAAFFFALLLVAGVAGTLLLVGAYLAECRRERRADALARFADEWDQQAALEAHIADALAVVEPEFARWEAEL